jgi:hypothetical protein
MEFDDYLKNTCLIKPYYEDFISYIIPKLELVIIKSDIFFIVFWIFPRLVMLTALFIDVFIFNQLHYKYMVIFFGLLLFFNRYFKYSLKTYKKKLIETNRKYISNISTPYVPGIHPSELEQNYDPEEEDHDVCPEIMDLPLENFIEFQTESIVYGNITREIEIIFSTQQLRDELWHKHFGHSDFWKGFKLELPENYINIFGDKIPDNNYQAQSFIEEIENTFKKNQINKIVTISLLIEYYTKTNNFNEKFKKIKLLIYVNYLLCWLYILIVSIQTLNIAELMLILNKTWLTLQDPFTETAIIEYLHIL